jgi:formylglycine-generating enzyme required for sulfatase activity
VQTPGTPHTPWRLILGAAGVIGALVVIALLASANRPVSPTAPVIVEVTRVVTPPMVATPTPVPTLGIGSTQVSDKDGMTLLYVPAGEFTMGSNEYDDEKPIHKVTLDAFWIDQTEVTNAMFKKFVDSTNYQTDAEEQGRGYCLM